MALRLGVGDAFTMCKGVVDLCRASHPESKEVQLIVTEMESIRAHLKALETQIGDEKTFSTARPDISPIIKRSLEPLHKDLAQMRELLHEQNRRPSVHVLDQVRYMVMYKAELDGFRDKLPAHSESMCVIQELIDGETQSERRSSILKLGELIEVHESMAKDQEVHDSEQEEVVKILEEACMEEERHLSTSEVLDQLEDELVAKGSSPEKAEEQLFSITKALFSKPHPYGSGSRYHDTKACVQIGCL